jgi:hypothetical protein
MIKEVNLQENTDSLNLKKNDLYNLIEHVEIERSKRLTKKIIMLTCDLLIESKRLMDIYDTFLVTDFKQYFSFKYLEIKLKEYLKYFIIKINKRKIGGIISVCTGLGSYIVGFGSFVSCPLIVVGALSAYLYW